MRNKFRANWEAIQKIAFDRDLASCCTNRITLIYYVDVTCTFLDPEQNIRYLRSGAINANLRDSVFQQVLTEISPQSSSLAIHRILMAV